SVFCDFYFQRGIYTKTDSVYTSIKPFISSLPTYDKELIAYYHYEALFHKGFLNRVTNETDLHKTIVSAHLTKDSIFNASGNLYVAKLNENEKSIRENLVANYVLLKATAYLKNGLSDSAIAYLQKNISDIPTREGGKARYHYLLGQCYFNNLEYHLAEKEFKTASALSQQFFQPHAPIQINIEQGLINTLIQQGKSEEADYYRNDIAVRLYSYYNKDNLSYLTNTFPVIEYEMSLHNWAKAEIMVKDFLRTNSLPKEHYLREKYLTLLFSILIKQQKYTEAEQTMSEMLALQTQLTGSTSPAYQILLLNKANFYSFYLDKFKEAKTIYSSVLDSDFQNQISLENPDYYLNTLDFAKTYIYTEEFGMADNRLQLNLKRVENKFSNTHTLYAIYLSHQGELKTITGDYSNASRLISNSLAIFEKNNKKKYFRAYIEALELNLKLHVLEGDYVKADASLLKAKQVANAAGITETDDIFLVEEIGLLYVKKGEYQKGNKILSAILRSKIETVGEAHKSICSTLNYLGEQNLITGNYAESDGYFSRSLQISKNVYGDKSIPYATSLLYYKQLYTAIGDYEQAESSILEALQIYTKTYGDKNIKTGILMHEAALATFQADLYTGRKNKTKQADLDKQFLKALDIVKNAAEDNSTLYADGLENYAIFLALTNQYTSSLSNIETAKKIWENKLGKNNVHSAQLNSLSGKIYYRSGKYSDALSSFEKTRDEYKTIFDDNHPGYVLALGSCAQMYYILGNTSKAIESIEECTNKSLLYIDKVFPFLSERGKMAYWDKIKDDFEFYKTVAFTNSKEYPDMIGKIMNIQLQTKSILLNSQLKIKNQIYQSGDTTAIRLYQTLQDLRDNLAIAYSMNAAQRKEDGIDIASMEVKLEVTEKQLSTISDDFSDQSRTKTVSYTWKNIKQSLQDNEIAIETIPFRYFTKSFSDTIWYAFVAVTNKSSNPDFVIVTNGKELETKQLKYYRNMIKFSTEDKSSYNQYWKPVSTLLSPSVSNIYFATDGVYNQINVETLKDAQGTYLINSSNIIYIGSCRDVINKNILVSKSAKTANTTKSEIDLIGNPTYYASTNNDDDGSTLEQLPGSETEVKKINALLTSNNWKTHMYIGTAATEDTVKHIKSPNVLHVSTHGFFWEDLIGSANDISEKSIVNPLLMSGIVLFNGGSLLGTDNTNSINKVDGILTAYEAMNLALDKTELVVLSACETGLGEVKIGEGVYGLQRSFTVAGAKSIIMSLSKVSDEVTIKLMENFYMYWLQSGNKREAFNKAKKELMKEYPDPKYWGAFIMIGL
ncbi:MAG TPA: CHAT domain-containing tetratricopeptide repeat protein, partial [Cytophaga sp.]|nr:CHAT domain-containing tetratricopeptide repeat protein [Cytophaga sp.]